MGYLFAVLIVSFDVKNFNFYQVQLIYVFFCCQHFEYHVKKSFPGPERLAVKSKYCACRGPKFGFQNSPCQAAGNSDSRKPDTLTDTCTHAYTIITQNKSFFFFKKRHCQIHIVNLSLMFSSKIYVVSILYVRFW